LRIGFKAKGVLKIQEGSQHGLWMVGTQKQRLRARELLGDEVVGLHVLQHLSDESGGAGKVTVLVSFASFLSLPPSLARARSLSHTQDVQTSCIVGLFMQPLTKPTYGSLTKMWAVVCVCVWGGGVSVCGHIYTHTHTYKYV
jgi:hypothetical protein